VVDHFYTSVVESPTWRFSLVVLAFYIIVSIRVMASKMTTTINFEVEKVQLLVVKDASNVVAHEGWHTQGPAWY